MKSSDFVKLVEAECAIALRQYGFGMKAGIGHRQINDNFVGWVGLNNGRHEKFIRINPFVGVHCPAIMKITAAACSKRYRLNDVATYAVFLGELCPHVEEFIFDYDGDIRNEAERLSKCIAAYGVPFMESISNYSALLPVMEERIPSLGGYPERYAAALLVSGDVKAALTFIESASIQFQKVDEGIVKRMEYIHEIAIAKSVRDKETLA